MPNTATLLLAMLLLCNVVSNNNQNYQVLAVPVPVPEPLDADTYIVKYENDNSGIDGYNFSFETSDGVSRSESASLSNIGTDHEAISVQGFVSWVSPDGQHYKLNYLADENGFQPEGEHLPVAPEAR